MQTRIQSRSKLILEDMDLRYAKCFIEHFSMSEIKTCTRLTHIQTAQALVTLHSDLVEQLTQIK